ncbi:DUF1697 domain-containing protein [Chromobacterium sphagni]|uniref:DUF1697 domain-containing protein n=1 Tax=Chromobacterium sphagni TaxID=1903179 RepID=A0ABX3CHF7_9NEIS|nr:DUF1697 domain-containing protein [Chromobacterium sphagni]OHX21783.1 hypothetical protein BI344_04560 [Chromobacterium sphagni]
MEHCIALIRGINVGKAKRIAMADLRQLAAELGGQDAVTVLNSGNLLCRYASTAALAADLEAGIAARFGFSARVITLGADALPAIIAGNPLRDIASNPSRLLVAFSAAPAALQACHDLTERQTGTERLALGSHAAYFWSADSILDSKLLQAFNQRTGDSVTTRNWATVLKLQQALAR